MTDFKIDPNGLYPGADLLLIEAERDALRAQRDAAVEALAFISITDDWHEAKKWARAALLLARGTL